MSPRPLSERAPQRAHVAHPVRSARAERGVALLMVLTAVAVLTLVLVEFSRRSTIHLNEGVYVRDEVRANVVADTALDLTRACLDRAAWGAFGAFQSRVNLEKVCNLLLGVFIRGQISLPIGDVNLEGIQGIKLDQGQVDEIDLRPESSFIGLVGLACPPPTSP